MHSRFQLSIFNSPLKKWVQEPEWSIYDSCYATTGNYRVEQADTTEKQGTFIYALVPNPNCKGKEFAFSVNKDCKLQIFDATGRLVQSLSFVKGVSKFTLSAYLSAGYYYCRIQSGAEVKTEKIALIQCE